MYKHYKSQRVNSEASLQASVWSHLNEIFEKENLTGRRLFVEPTVRVVDDAVTDKHKIHRRYPDLVVCSTRQIIAFVELKYVPRGKPNTKRDLDKFLWIEKHRSDIAIKNERYLGEAIDDTTYRISKNVLYVWCGIYNATEPNDLSAALPVELHRNLHLRHELTSIVNNA